MTISSLRPTQRLAFCLVHSIWQASAIALATSAVVRLMKRQSAEFRYATYVAGLALMPMLSIATFLSYDRAGSIVSGIIELSDISPLQSANFTAWTQWAVLFWMTGVAVSSVRLTLSWLWSRRLLRLADVAVPPAVAELFASINERIGLTRTVRLMFSKRIEVPVVVGWLQPVVLVPLSAVTRLEVDQLRAVLAHELAHIRRHDFVINLLQRCVESVMFYHPAVWWLSSRTRSEREHCCDDLAVKVCGNRLMYAHALVALEQARTAESILAVAANGGSLSRRVKRILGSETTQPDRLTSGFAGLFVGVWLLAGVWQSDPLLAQHAVGLPLEIPAITQRLPEPSLFRMALMAMSGVQVGAVPMPKTSIEGRVVRIGTNEPLRAQVNLRMSVDLEANPNGRPGQFNTRAYSTYTDGDGKFIFDDVTPGLYLLSASANGFVRNELGGPVTGEIGRGRKINITAGQPLKDFLIRMTPAGNVSGQIRDEEKWPAIGAEVQLLRVLYNAQGEKTYQALATTRADDRGEYRFFWVQPGRYYLAAGTFTQAPQPIHANAPQDIYAITYYPGAMDATEATALEVRPGGELNAIDLTIPRQLSYRIRGRVVDSRPGVARGPLTISLLLKSATNNASAVGATFLSESFDPATGVFEKAGVKPGSYVLSVQAGTVRMADLNVVGGHGPAGADMIVTVTNTDIDGVTLTIADPVTIPGRLVVEGGDVSAVGNVDRFRVSLSSGKYSTVTGNGQLMVPRSRALNPDGTFQTDSVRPDVYKVTVSRLPADLYIKEIRFDGKDVLNNPLQFNGSVSGSMEVILSAKGGQITGSVVDEKKQSVRDTQVVLVPDRNRDRTELYKTATTNSAGAFTINGVAPGSYKLYAWETIEPFAYYDADFVRSSETAGTPVQVAESGKLTVEVRLIPSGGR